MSQGSYRSITTVRMVRSLRSATCPACGKKKKPNYSFCYGCFNQLSQQQKSGLYERLGKGYRKAFEKALRALGAERIHWPESA
jgi:uncharacterized protein with PIN domain